MCVVCTNSKLPEYYFCCFHESKRCLVKGNPRDTPRRINVHLMTIIRWYVEEKNRQIYTSFRHIFSMSEKLTSFWHNLFDVITMTKKSTSFRHNFFDVISMGEKSTSIWHALFDTILMIKKSMPLRRTFFYLILMVKKLSLFRCIFWCNFHGKLMQIRGADFDLFLKTKNRLFDTSFWKVFDISKTKPVWTSLLDVILFPCTFSK